MASISLRVFCSLCLISLVSSTAFAADAAKGKELYGTYCGSCHGAEGAGDGPTAAALPADQKPGNFQTRDFKVVKDDASMLELLKKGGPAFKLSPLMAPMAHLSDDDLNNIIAFVNSLNKG